MKRHTMVGIHLWYVKLENASVDLWITTRPRSPDIALRKANRLVKRDYKHDVKVSSVEYNGTIDA